jgi:uncharacterized protein with NRDE domain
MCTVSFFNTGNSLIFTSNRDEKKDREKAVFPNILDLGSNILYFPKDKKASGTWFVADENGNVAILLNGAFQKHESNPPYKKSRGIILLDLAKSENILDAFRDYDLSGVEPFQLLVYSQDILFRLLWDGMVKYKVLLDTNKSYLLCSSTLYNNEIVEEREQKFKKFQNNKEINSQKIINFHKSHLIEKEPHIEESVKEKYSTVSITQLVITKENLDFTYHDLMEKTIQTKRNEKKTLV